MSFLSRQRSLNQQHNFPSSKNTGKPLPALPPFDPVENIPVRKQKSQQNEKYATVEGSPNTGAGRNRLIRRVSSIFRPSSLKRKTGQFATHLHLRSATASPAGSPSQKQGSHPPSAFAAYSATGCSSEDTHYDSDVDDIRRPSGLGRSASFTSHRSMPMTPTTLASPQTSPEQEDSAEYVRSRTSSSPNLLRSLSQKAKNKFRPKRASISHIPSPVIVSELPPSPPLPPKSKQSLHPPPVQRAADSSCRLPVEVLDVVLLHLPRKHVCRLARISRAFSLNVRLVLYQTLDFQTLSGSQVEKLVALLASRRDLSELVVELSCTTWPTFFNAGRHSFSVPASATPPDRENQLRNTLLTATFTLALQRMSNLINLTLPCFDLSLLSQHSAFGLRHLTFMNHTMSTEEATSLFTWLDGQINITSLSLPNLEDYQVAPMPIHPHLIPAPPATTMADDQTGRRPDGNQANRVSDSASVTPTYYLDTPAPLTGTNGGSPFTQNNPYLRVSPITSPVPSPMVAGFGNVPAAAVSSTSLVSPGITYDSSTLLPKLTTLHATPGFLAYLVPQTGVSSSAASTYSTSLLQPSTTENAGMERLGRPLLRKVSLNISTNLYDGLRPSAVMTRLRGIEQLEIRFCESVDRRTVEKVVTVVSSALGAGGAHSSSGSGSSASGSCESTEEPRGLKSLRISFKSESALSKGMEDMVFRTLQATLSRYARLEQLDVTFSSSRFGPAKPLPLSPLNISVANASMGAGIKSTIVSNTPTINDIVLNGVVEGQFTPQEPDRQHLSPGHLGADVDPDRLSVSTGVMNKGYKFPSISATPSPTAQSFVTAKGGSGASSTRSSKIFVSDVSGDGSDGSSTPVAVTTTVVAAAAAGLGGLAVSDDQRSFVSSVGSYCYSVSDQPQGKMEMWARQCPSLKSVAVGGVRWTSE
ncbi:hypothetical protein FA15DRAFT_669568 [Coprinopsis marcescibilis]|uniref:F-box domain-containing protein n=1 Tax=Coprinopsis marcescibilis TaxID=230819 RepID=A0A5C3KUY7_COPMA|nr:hypothetical protein FA15DRAFT_669568 [Coprinopsis marcescibilis]